MNLSRRNFLKLTVAGFAVTAMPSLARTPIQGFIPESPVTMGYRISNLNKGDYWVSYTGKKANETIWCRYSKQVIIENDGDYYDIEYELNKGDCVKMMQFERSTLNSGFAENLISDCSGGIIKNGAAVIDNDRLGFPCYKAV